MMFFTKFTSLNPMKSILFFLIVMFFSSPAVHAIEQELGDRELIHLLEDQPNYFLFGGPETKIQLSFKAKLMKNADLYFAYTQKIFWDLFLPSSPFRDLTYNPSFFYRFHIGHESLLDVMTYEHESNGKGGDSSRSWDRVGVRYQTVQHFEKEMRGEWSIHAWIPYKLDSGNQNIARYRGVYEVTFTLFHFLGPYFDLDDLSLKIYPGGKSYVNPLEGGQELTFRIKGKSVGFLANAVFQLFQGYGENMLECDQRVFGARAGIGF